jgi:hypothetical protein
VDPAVTRGDRKMYQANRLARRRAAGAGNAGDGNREIDAGFFQRADRHRGGVSLLTGRRSQASSS